MREAARAASFQDLAEDDRKHLQWCLGQLSQLVGNLGDREQRAALDFVQAILTRDYGLDLNARTQDDSYAARAEAAKERRKAAKQMAGALGLKK